MYFAESEGHRGGTYLPISDFSVLVMSLDVSPKYLVVNDITNPRKRERVFIKSLYGARVTSW